MARDLAPVELVARIDTRYFRPELRRVIHVARMTEFVDKDVVDQRIGQLHQSDVETDRTPATATAPPSTAVTETNAVVAESPLASKRGQPIGQVKFSFTAQDLGNFVADELLDVCRIKLRVRRQFDDESIVGGRDLGFADHACGYDCQLMPGADLLAILVDAAYAGVVEQLAQRRTG